MQFIAQTTHDYLKRKLSIFIWYSSDVGLGLSMQDYSYNFGKGLCGIWKLLLTLHGAGSPA